MDQHVRDGATGGLSAAFARMSTNSSSWSAARIMDEGLDLVRDASWADSCSLHSIVGTRAVEVAARPAPLCSGGGTPGVPLGWFPWGLAPVTAQRFVLVEDAAALPVRPGSDATLGRSGIVSCLHLPILERERTIGALHLFWHEPRLGWDDDRGRLLRVLGRFLLGRCDVPPAPEPPGRTL